MKINSTIFFTISSLLYSSLLMIAYFSKDRIKTPENKIYSRLIIINFIGIILEIFCTIFAGYAKENIIFYTILNKLFLIGLIVWGAVFGSYVFLISSAKKNEEELKKYMKNVLGLYITLIIIIAVLVEVLPVYFNYRNNYVMYSYGPAVNVVYSGIFITIFLTIICLIKNFKNIISKKYLPIYAYLFVGTIITFIQKMMPELLLAITMDTFITVIMYFTIENPDKKLLQEIHASKKMADEANEEKSMLIYNMMGEIKDIAKDINISSNNILDSNNIEENKYYAREIISSNNKLYNMSDKIYNIDKIELNKIKTVKTKYNIKLLLKQPFGAGLGALFPFYNGAGVLIGFSNTIDNSYLTIAEKMGVITGIIYIYVIIIKPIWYFLKNNKNKVYLGCLVAYSLFLINSSFLTAQTINGIGVSSITWILIAFIRSNNIGEAKNRYDNKRKRSNSN